jgi:hypothetical protein
MNQTITIGEFILISVGCILAFAFIKAIIDTLKDMYYDK